MNRHVSKELASSSAVLSPVERGSEQLVPCFQSPQVRGLRDKLQIQLPGCLLRTTGPDSEATKAASFFIGSRVKNWFQQPTCTCKCTSWEICPSGAMPWVQSLASGQTQGLFFLPSFSLPFSSPWDCRTHSLDRELT